MGETKICTICGEEKNLSEFYRHIGAKDGYFNECKKCICIKKKTPEFREKNRIRIKELRAKYPEKYRERAKKWYRANPERYREKNTRYRTAHREEYKLMLRRYIENLTDGYVSRVMGKRAGELTPEVLESKRLIMQLKRELKSNNIKIK